MFHTYRRAFRKNYINCFFVILFVCTFNTHAYLTKRHPTQVGAVHSWRKLVLFCLDLENGSFSMIIFGTTTYHWVDLYVIFFDSSVMRCFFYWDGNGPCCWWCDASLGPKQPSGKRKSELVLTLKGSPTESTISIQKIELENRPEKTNPRSAHPRFLRSSILRPPLWGSGAKSNSNVSRALL